MNWLKWFLQLLAMAPAVVQTVQVVAGQNASGASKQEMARTALHAATDVASAIDPGDAATIAAATVVTNAIIDSTVAKMKATGELKNASAPVTAGPTV